MTCAITPLGLARVEYGPDAGGPRIQPGSLLERAAWMVTWCAFTRNGVVTFADLRAHRNITLEAPGQEPNTLEAAAFLGDCPEGAIAEAVKRGWVSPLLC